MMWKNAQLTITTKKSPPIKSGDCNEYWINNFIYD